MGVWVGFGKPHTHTHMHAHTCTRAHTCMRYRHDNFMQMAAPIGISHWEFPMMSYACVCMCVHVRACVGVAATHPHPHPPTHPPPRGGPPEISKNTIRLERIEIFRFRLKIWNLWRIPHPWVGVVFGGWVDGWAG